MKATSSILFDFIYDHKLDVSDTGVCFEAMIEFNLPAQNFNLPSAVHIESFLFNRVDSIYLLNPLIEQHRLPTFFNDVNHRFFYLKQRGLMIAGTMPLFGAYTISIIPNSQICKQKTFDELRAKKLN